jgi:uncharacterized protein (TIGR02679 family)
MTGTPSSLPKRLHAYLSVPDLTEVWQALRARLERNGLQVTGTLVVDLSEVAADRLSGLLSRSISPGPGRRLKLAELDTALRHSAAGQGLISVLEVLSGQPLTDRTAARRDSLAEWAHVWQHLDASVAEAGLADASWVPDWIAGLRRTGILTRAGTGAAIRALTHALSALEILAASSPPHALERPSDDWPGTNATSMERGTLATRVTGDAHGLDDSQLASAVLLRAAAAALGRSMPESAADRRELWQVLGVATDTVSGTVLVWALRPPGSDPWSTMMRQRADLGLITHLTVHELEQAGDVALAAPGETLSVCENPQVLQAVAHARASSPLICLSGNPAVAATTLLRALIHAGHSVRYHGDFDWPGVAIAGRVIALGATPWRMLAVNYQNAVATLDAEHAVALTGKPVPTPWDPALASAMAVHGLAVHEESIVDELIADLPPKF